MCCICNPTFLYCLVNKLINQVQKRFKKQDFWNIWAMHASLVKFTLSILNLKNSYPAIRGQVKVQGDRDQKFCLPPSVCLCWWKVLIMYQPQLHPGRGQVQSQIVDCIIQQNWSRKYQSNVIFGFFLAKPLQKLVTLFGNLSIWLVFKNYFSV
jgi:hypothetical protein